MIPEPSIYTQAQSHGINNINSLNGRPSPADAGLARHSKRKASDTPEGNERLSKRLSLLNLEASGTKMYVPVEAPLVVAPNPAPAPVKTNTHISGGPVMPPVPQEIMPTDSPTAPSLALEAVPQPSLVPPPQPRTNAAHTYNAADADMHVDDTKYKVYIYNIDDELADDERSVASDTEAAIDDDATDGASKLVFLPDIDKHLRSAARTAALTGRAPGASDPKKLIVPRPILPNKDGELAGMQLVLYHDPSSLSVPRESDSVRKAILDARARIRERQQEEKAELPTQPPPDQQQDADTSMASTPASTPPPTDSYNDLDAMDID
ncbi:hypothetical protein SEUCBS140593_000298 [Sporothrix eucalyptigena]|uniref:Uncharacterized protein n=1 Tax=Sporothrix eucalyptigena TaxID=1812306 RepID=A0ABP0ANP9_9PEZI